MLQKGILCCQLSGKFKNEVDLNTIPGKQNIPDEDREAVLAEMKMHNIFYSELITDLEELQVNS